jgi:hypothetical protein
MADQPITDADLDAITRTVLGESSSDPMERAAVAHVILNRTAMGKSAGFADTITGVVHQPNAFEAWSNKTAPNYPRKFDQKSQDYQQARQIVEAVANGTLPDPTGGYVHFLEPSKVQERVNAGKMQWPSWAPPGTGMQIGKQVFYPHENSDAIAAQELESERQQNRQIRALDESDAAAARELERERRIQRAAIAGTDDDPLIQKYFGKQQPSSIAGTDDDPLIQKYFGKATAPTPSAAASMPSNDALPTAPQIGTGRTWETPEERAASVARGGTGQSTNDLVRSVLQAKDVFSPASAWEKVKNIAVEGSENFGAGLQQAGKAPADWMRNQPATALGNIGGGMLGMASAYPSALLHHGVEEPATQATGSPEIGKRAADVASLIPLVKGGAAVNAARPAVQGLKDLVESIPADDLAAGIKRLENNPRLSPAAVFPQIRAKVVDTASRPGPWKDMLDRAQRGLAKETRTVGEEQIQPIIDAAKKPADITPVLNLIDKEFGSDVVARRTLEAYKSGEKLSEFYPLSAYQKELLRWRDKLVGPREASPGEPKFLSVGGEQGLHQIQSDMRGKNDKLREPGLSKIREAIKDQIESVAPGYRDSLSAYHDAADMRSLGEDLQTAGVKSEKTTNRSSSEPPEPRKPGSGMSTLSSLILSGVAEAGAGMAGFPHGIGAPIFAVSRTVPPVYRHVMSKVDMARWRMRNQAAAEHAIAPAGSAEGTIMLNLLRGRLEAEFGRPQSKLSDLVTSPFVSALPR